MTERGEQIRDIIRELRDEYPAVDVTTVGFSRDFAGVGCCVIPQDRVLAIISTLESLGVAQGSLDLEATQALHEFATDYRDQEEMIEEFGDRIKARDAQLFDMERQLRDASYRLEYMENKYGKIDWDAAVPSTTRGGEA